MNRIEAGEVTVSRTDLEALVRHLEIDDGERLLDDARAARRRGWWNGELYRNHLGPTTLAYLQFEVDASEIRFFSPTVIPGMLQTRAYAEAIFDVFRDEISDEERTARIDVRMARWGKLLERSEPPRVFVILDESVIMREVGGPRLMADQLQYLLKLGEQAFVAVRILPLADATFRALLGHFTIIDLVGEENAMLYRESHLGDEVVDALDTVVRYRKEFEDMWPQTLSEAASARLIEARAALMRSSLDRHRS